VDLNADHVTESELVRRYVIVRCAHDLLTKIREGTYKGHAKALKKLREKHVRAFDELNDRVTTAGGTIRTNLIAKCPEVATDGFLEWFDEVHGVTLPSTVAKGKP
jgi:hypothetical protein